MKSGEEVVHTHISGDGLARLGLDTLHGSTPNAYVIDIG